MDKIENQKNKLTFTQLDVNKASKELQEEIAVSKKSKKVALTKGKHIHTIRVPKGNHIVHPISSSVNLLLAENSKVDLTKLITVKDVIDLDKSNPQAIAGFDPPIFDEYVKNFKLTSHVNIGEIVTFKRQYFVPKGDIKRKIVDMEFVSLSNMSIIVYILEDRDRAMAHLAIPTKV